MIFGNMSLAVKALFINEFVNVYTQGGQDKPRKAFNSGDRP